MNTTDLAKVDLNLLISLQILLEEKNVSRAAARMHITQPAMSKTLSRLRHVFDDALFTRSSHGMQPTPRAKELGARLNPILDDVSQLIAGSQFDPAAYKGEIKLALSEYIGVALLPPLMQRLQQLAPLLTISVITRVENQLEALSRGELDFAVHMKQQHYTEDFRVRPLGSSPPTILVRDGHPLTVGKPDWSELARYPPIRLYVSDWEQVEIQRHAKVVSNILEHPRGALEISHLLTALEILRDSDYFMPAPAYILQNETATSGITALPLPGGSYYELDYVLVAHTRTANSPIHNWLWGQITRTISELRTPATGKIRQRLIANSDGAS